MQDLTSIRRIIGDEIEFVGEEEIEELELLAQLETRVKGLISVVEAPNSPNSESR